MDKPKQNSSIRNKIIYIILFCSLFFLIGFYFFSYNFLLKSFKKLENDQVVINIHRVEASLKNIIETQSIKLKDWAYWDDTYKFIEDKNQEYIVSNLTNESLSSLQINFIGFINKNDEIIFSKFVDIETGIDLPQDEVINFIKSNINLIKEIDGNNDLNNIIKLPNGEMIISVDQILKSDQSGSSRGNIIFGTYVNDKLIEKISYLVGFDVLMHPYNSYSDMNDIVSAKNSLSKDSDHYISSVDDFVYGYTYLFDISNDPLYIMQVEVPRSIYNQGQNTVYLQIFIIILAIILIGFLIAVLFEKFIIKRLINLGYQVRDISMSGDFSKNLKDYEDDEIGMLSNSINLMLQKVREAEEKEKKLDEDQRLMNEKIKAHSDDLEKINKLMIGRELKMIELKKENLRLKNQKV